jgi:hypothetical protein
MRLIVSASLIFLSPFVLAADEKAPAQPGNEQIEKDRAAEALELCRRGAREYRLCLDDARQTELELKPEPLLRWSNPAVGSIHGVVFVWTNKGRPAAIASIFKWFEPNRHMAFEVHSLSETPLLGILGKQPVWNSSRAGVQFKPVPGAPAPAETAAGRLTQMRSISKDFIVEKTDRDDGSKQQMRLLTQPIFRYQSESAHISDGAIFAFVQGTDPEVLLLLEAREENGGASWHYALARMNSTVFRVSYKNDEVWKTEVVPWGVVFDNRQPYNILNLDHLSPGK